MLCNRTICTMSIGKIEVIHLILTGIGDEIYSTVDACQTAQEMWEAIERLQQGKEYRPSITPPSESLLKKTVILNKLRERIRHAKKLLSLQSTSRNSTNLSNNTSELPHKHQKVKEYGLLLQVGGPIVQQSWDTVGSVLMQGNLGYYAKEWRKAKKGGVPNAVSGTDAVAIENMYNTILTIMCLPMTYNILTNLNPLVTHVQWKWVIFAYDKLKRRLNETLGLLAQKEIDIKESLKVKAYEISVVKEKHDELVKQSLLTKSHYEGLVKEENKFDKPSVVRQPNAQRIPKPSVLGKPAPFSDSLERKYFAKKKSVLKTNESEGLSKPVTPQNLPQTAKQAVRNTNVIKPGMYRIASSTTQTRAPQLNQTSRNTNPRVSTSTGVAHKTNVSRPQPRSNQMKDKVVPNTSHVKFKKTEVEEHPRISSISNQTKSVTACNDSLNSRTSNVNAVCATCGKCVFNSNHDACVSKFLKDVNARTKKPNVVPISTRKPKSQANKSVATPHKKTVASESTITNSKSYYRMLYKKTNKAWKWWIAQQCPSAYTWVPKTKRKWVPKVRNESVTKKIVQLILFIVDSGCTKHMTGNLSLLCNFVEKYLGTVRFGNDQFAPILGYGDLVQGNITIKRVYYVEGLNHNLFSVGQFCDADLEVAFRKSTCFVRDLQGNDLLTGNRGTDLYTISLQETTSSTPICLMAKASPTQAWLWHRRLSHLNFDYINLLSKKDVVIGLPKLKYVKDQLCSSCEVSKAKRSSFKSKTVPSSKGRLNLLHMDLCGPMRVASINGKKYILVIVDDYYRYTWTLFLRSKDETQEVLKDFLTMIQRNLQAPVTSVRTDRGTEFLNTTLNAFFKEEGIEHQTSTPRTPEQNDVVERRNRTLVEAARTMLSASKLLLFFWAEAIATTYYTQNRSIIIPTHEKTAYHIINDRKSSIKHLHIFGCTCYLTRDGENLDKIKEKGDPCILVGYSTQSKGYRVYNKRTRLIVESIHLKFDEIKEMSETSVVNNTSGLVPQRQKAADYDNPDPAPELQNVSPSADTTVPSQQELDLLRSFNKKDEDQTVIRNKARLIAKGYAQEEGIDFEESFSRRCPLGGLILEQAQRDKKWQKNLHSFYKVFQKLYKPTQLTPSNFFKLQNKTEDTTPGVPLQDEQADWLEDTDKEINEQELEAHYSYMAKIQEVSPEESSSTGQPLEQCIEGAISCRDSCLIALQNKQNEFEKYKAFNDRTIDYEILQTKLNETLGLLALKDIEIKEGLKTKAYEISVLNQKHVEVSQKESLTNHNLEDITKKNTKIDRRRTQVRKKMAECRYVKSALLCMRSPIDYC
ncbi:retrovirus-related pol polyprotein from transposon TNT 1-94 [Tanacetum coccineum]|uniref:Retrovirus-related pol polyprotein from transposon TNT 1-94 n=1 Tax=Tanacetum coccineum TaxID=301880 RepID=A0ABQ5C8P8_9ASTR